MSSKPRIDRNAKIDSSGHLKSSMEMLTKRAAQMGKHKIGDLIDVPLGDIVVSSQVRNDAKDIDSLAESIREEGQRSPIEVYYNEDDKLALLSGERRYRSLEVIGAAKARAIVVKPPQDVSDKILRQLSENEERESLTPLDRGRAYSQLKEAGLSQSEIARRVRRNRMAVRRHILLYEAPEPIQEAYRDELVTDLHAIEMLARVLEHYPEDFPALMASARESGGMGRETLENWLAWRDSPKDEAAPRGTDGKDIATAPMGTDTPAAETALMRTGEGGATTAPMGTGLGAKTEHHAASPGASKPASHEAEKAARPAPGLKLPEERPGQATDAPEPTAGRPEKGQGTKPAPASPADQVLEAHYQGAADKVAPQDLYIEVTARLLDGKTKVSGRMLTDKVDQDSEWVWIVTHDKGQELRVKAKSLKVLRVTA